MRVVFDICPNCSKEFTKTGNRQIFCSDVCQKSSGRLQRNKNSKLFELNHPERVMFNRAVHRSRKKEIEFNLEREDVKIPEYCPILGIKLKINQTGRPGFFDDSPSLDRIDPKKGYTKDNIRVISNRANLLKSNASVEELEKILEDARSNRL